MSKVLEILNRLGSDGSLRHANRQSRAEVLAQCGLPPDVEAAILDGNGKQLERLLGADGNACCLIEVIEDELESATQ